MPLTTRIFSLDNALEKEPITKTSSSSATEPPNAPDGGNDDDDVCAWDGIAKRLVTLGMVDVAGIRLRTCLPASEARGIIDYWEGARGKWDARALHYRLASGVPGVSPAEGWPRPNGTPPPRPVWEPDPEVVAIKAEQQRIRAEVLRDAKEHGWSQEQIKAELRRRNGVDLLGEMARLQQAAMR